MNEDTDPVTRAEFTTFASSLTVKLHEVAKVVNAGVEAVNDISETMHAEFTHIYMRLDDIDRKIEILTGRSKTMEGDITDIKGDVHAVKNDTRLIPQLIGAFKLDGFEIVDLQSRVGDLEKEKRSKEET